MLLDTHVLLWLLAAPERLGTVARGSIDAAARVLFSPVSVAELRIKQMLGRITVPEGLVSILLDSGLLELPLTSGHADGLTEFETLARHDPFDRLLLAQAAIERCDLLTADHRLLDLRRAWILDARR